MRFFCSAKVRAGARAVPGTVACPSAPGANTLPGEQSSPQPETNHRLGEDLGGEAGEADGRKRATKGEKVR